MAEGNSIINLGDWSKPVNTFIEKIANAVGILYEPKRIIKKAKAEALADEIKEINKLHLDDLKKRAIQRLLNEETLKQNNIENIIEKTIPLINDSSNAEILNDDWLSNFFDKSKLVSDSNMQILWSKILAGETNNPGSFSKFTLKIISELEEKDAKLFTLMGSSTFIIGNPTPVIFISEDENRMKYELNGISFEGLTHLETIGLIKFNSLSGFARLKLPKIFNVIYFNYPIKLEMQNETENRLNIGNILLTQAGKELINICGAIPNSELRQLALDKWKKEGIVIH